jgi:hypothetical protein
VLLIASCAGGIADRGGNSGWEGDASAQDAADGADTRADDDNAPDVTSESTGTADGSNDGGGTEAAQEAGSPIDSSGGDTTGVGCSPSTCAFVDLGCSVQCDSVSTCWPHVNRSYKASTGEHFYTTNDTEAACCGFTVEDKPYYYLYSTQQVGLVPFYRCLLSTGFHFYTTSSSCEGNAGATNEGSMGYIATSATCGAIPLYRLYDATNGDHLYTTSSAEMTSAESGGYTYESIAGYVWSAPES